MAPTPRDAEPGDKDMLSRPLRDYLPRSMTLTGDGVFRRLLRWVGGHELSVLVSVLVLALGSFVFVKVAEEVGEGETRALDRAIILWLRHPNSPLVSPFAEEVGRDLTALGGGTVLALVTLFSLGYLALLRKRRSVVFVSGAVVSAALASGLLKMLFQRERPDLVPHLSNVITTSFPSGHSMLSAAVYLTLASLLARLHASLLLKAYIVLWGAFIAGLVGLSRVYVGVHWPTDVLAGWAAGAAWASAWSLLARVLQRKGKLEPPAPPPERDAAS